MNVKITQCGVHYRHGTGFVVDRPNGAGEYVFVCTHTPVAVRLGRGRDTIEPAGTCFLFSPTAAYHYEPVGDLFDNTWFHATGTGFARLVSILGIPTDQPLHPGRHEFVVPLVHEMGMELAHGALHVEQMAALAAHKLLVLLTRYLHAKTPALSPTLSEHLERLRTVRMEVLETIERSWTVADMAAKANLSPSRFSAIYRQYFEVSPMEDLIRGRLTRAAWQLENTTMPVGAVAEACGFENAYYFSRLFHKRFGHPPSKHGR